MVAPGNTFDRLLRTMRQIDPNNPDGAWQMLMSGTVNTIGGGTGGTSTVDNNPFTPGGTSITPVGGYFGGRSVASGNAAAFSIDSSGNMQVNVVAGGAGGGIANLSVRGTANTDIRVGYASGAGFNDQGGAYVPILGTVNLGAGAAPYASVAVYGSPAMPIYNIGSVNVTNVVSIVGSVNPHGIFGSVSVIGSVNIVPPPNMTVWLANQNAGAGFASVAVYGSPANPIYNIGSVNVVNAVGIFGSVSTVGSVNATNLGGSVGVTQIGAPWSFVGSTSITPVAAFSLAGTSIVDVRRGITLTQFPIISLTAGVVVIASLNAAQRFKVTNYKLIATGTVAVAFQSPSGTYLEGTQQLLPGAGFVEVGAIDNPVMIGAANSGHFLLSSSASVNIGGKVVGYFE